jgi:hypothetical protein
VFSCFKKREKIMVEPIPTAAAPIAPQPTVASSTAPPVVTETTMTATVKPNLLTLLNNVKLDNILLSNGIGLGDALMRLSAAICRSGVNFDTNGNPTVRNVNSELGTLLKERLMAIPRETVAKPVTIGPDPSRPLFMQGEAMSCPINTEVLIPLSLRGPAPVFPETDNDSVATPAK